jgi:trypsin
MSSFDFELVFTGMCLLELDGDPPTRCTVHIPNAAHPDVVFKDVPEARRPFKHVPLLSFPTKFQVAGGSQAMRQVERVFPAADGEEIGVCDLAGETLTLQPPAGSLPLTLLTVKTDPKEVRAEDLFDWASSLQDLLTLSECTFSGIKASEVVTRVNLAHGQFGTLECGRQNGGVVVYEYDPVRGSVQPRPGRSLADAVVLRLPGLAASVVLSSNSSKGDFFFFPPHPLPAREVVRLCISNFHDTPQRDRNGLFDFLWYYNILDGLRDAHGQPPDPLGLFVPYIPRTIYGPITGSSGHCPPTMAVVMPQMGVQAQSDRVRFGKEVEGLETEPGEFPGSVALLAADGSLAGSGVLLDGDIVLTAGHVLEEGPVTVVVGTDIDHGSRHTLRAGLHRRPQGFDGGTHADDLLLLRLTVPIGGAGTIRATQQEVNAASEVTVVGFGFGNSSGPGGIQRKTDPPLSVRYPSCPSGDLSGCHTGKELVTDERGPGGVFSQDSGAPAYVQVGSVLKLAAIASRRVLGDQGIYVRLDAHDAWIQQAITELKNVP